MGTAKFTQLDVVHVIMVGVTGNQIDRDHDAQTPVYTYRGLANAEIVLVSYEGYSFCHYYTYVVR